MKDTKLKAHPYADLFPMMTPDELEGLADDVAENGLRQPVVLYQGKVLDGRNRLLACGKVNVEPAFLEHEGDDASALRLVISLNLKRREMSKGQRAVVAAQALPIFEQLHPRGRPKKSGKISGINGESRDEAAAIFNVNERYIQDAKWLLEKEPELAARVLDSTSSFTDALKDARDRQKLEELRKQKADRVARYKEAIKNEEITLEQALEEIMREEQEEKQKQEIAARARRDWLEEFVAKIEWLERNLCGEPDEQLAWYTRPGSPGLFEHGMTAGRIEAVIEGLKRSQHLSFGDTSDGQTREQGKKRRQGHRP